MIRLLLVVAAAFAIELVVFGFLYREVFGMPTTLFDVASISRMTTIVLVYFGAVGLIRFQQPPNYSKVHEGSGSPGGTKEVNSLEG